MELLQSVHPTFRYHYKWGPSPASYLAAERVAVFELFNPEFLERCKALSAKLPAPKHHGGISMREVGERWMGDASALLRQAMLDEDIALPDKARDFDPNVALLHDQVRYHHDMPVWSSVLGAWCVDGPERVLRFAQMGLEIPFRPGTVVLFDPAQPHGLLRPGAIEYTVADDAAAHSITMVSFMLTKEPSINELLGIYEYNEQLHANVRHTVDQYKVCDKTGSIAYR